MLGRELLTPDETRKLDNSECILLIRGCDPIIDKKYNTFAHSRFSETEDGGAAPYIHDRMAAKKQAVQILSEESLDYYKKKKEQGEDVQIVELSFDEVFSYEPIPKKIFSEEELKENQRKRTVEEVRPPKKTENRYRQRKKNFLNYWKAMFIMRNSWGKSCLLLVLEFRMIKSFKWQI